jgi:uncharacterized membrane protein
LSHLALYLVTLVVFLGVDAVWLTKVAGPLFRRRVGPLMLEEPRLGVAAGFYALYCVGVVYFAAAPAAGDPVAALIDGALFGFFAYATYEATNLSTLKGWTVGMAALDTAWGAALTGVSAAAAALIVG